MTCLHPKRIVRLFWLACVIVGLASSSATADSWPTYRHDMARSGITAEALTLPLISCWEFQARHAPEPAWGDPKSRPIEDILELRRAHFDDVFQPVAADGAVFFGSSADHKVYCLDASTGQIRWTRSTGGPVRLAPAIADGRAFVGSDDGYAYCLDVADGSVHWKYHAAPEDRLALGHGKMISLWPLRTGVLVDDGIAYLSAGIFPAEGVFLHAVRAQSGERIWCNDSCGESPQSRISPQGYLLASATTLYVPMGRVSPAGFDRAAGHLKHQTFFGKTVGGTYALLAGEHVYTGTEQIAAYHRESRDKFATFPGRKMVVAGDVAYLAADTELTAMARSKDPAVLWKTPCACPDALILAGGVLFGGGENQVVAVEAATGKQLWTAEVDGRAKGLAVADGRLLVSTDKGKIYCFGPQGSPQHGLVTQPTVDDPYADSASTARFQAAANAILAETDIRRGNCLVLGLETGQLALELARRSEMMIYAVSADADKVTAARKALDAAGVLGARVCVEHCPLEQIPYSDYFANLIVSETAVLTGQLPQQSAQMLRMLKPLGGTVIIGSPGSDAQTVSTETLQAWLDSSQLDGGQVVDKAGAWAKFTRGALPGAGSWTHQYATPGNTACSDDQLVAAPFGVLWFGSPGPGDMLNRHVRAASPLSMDGRMFIQGENTVMAYDVYNGLKLWQRDIPGAMRAGSSHDCGNLALSSDGLFVAVKDKCLRLDPATGETLATYQIPAAEDGKPRRWGYVACVGKLLYGSRSPAIDDRSRRRWSEIPYCDRVFAVDIETGQQRWVYQGKEIPNNTIAIGDATVFVLSKSATEQQRQQIIDQRGTDLPEAQLDKLDVRTLAAVDAVTGEVRWTRPIDVTGCGGWHAALKNSTAMISAMYNEGVLVFFGVYLDGHYWEQFFADQFDSRQVLAIAGDDGRELWSRSIGFRVRPLIVGNTLHAEPWAFDLHSGEQRTRTNPITGETVPWQFARSGHHCGCPAAAPNCLFFRSLNLAYYDLRGDYGTMHFGAQRPGCWINFIPAGGLLLMPEASTGCMCSFPTMCTVVFQPTKKQKAWAMYSTPGKATPVKRLAINLGAPGDRNDSGGDLWLSFPRPFKGRLVLPLRAGVTFHPGGRFARSNSVYTPFTETDDPWLFASAARGLHELTVPLIDKGESTATYSVRLAFADPENKQPGQRVFDIKLQGQTVAENFDIIEAAGAPNRAVVKVFDGIKVHDNLVLELLPKTANPTPSQLPILQGIEIVRQ